MKQVSRKSSIRAIIGTVTLLFLMCVPAPVYAACTAAGKYAFTIGAGSGRLVLSDDGRASMFLVDHLAPCDVCTLPSRTLTGTYQIGDIGSGECGIILDLAEVGGKRVSMSGVVAFQGLAILFQIASVSSFGPGLALRSDTLRGQEVP